MIYVYLLAVPMTISLLVGLAAGSWFTNRRAMSAGYLLLAVAVASALVLR